MLKVYILKLFDDLAYNNKLFDNIGSSKINEYRRFLEIFAFNYNNKHNHFFEYSKLNSLQKFIERESEKIQYRNDKL